MAHEHEQRILSRQARAASTEPLQREEPHRRIDDAYATIECHAQERGKNHVQPPASSAINHDGAVHPNRQRPMTPPPPPPPPPPHQSQRAESQRRNAEPTASAALRMAQELLQYHPREGEMNAWLDRIAELVTNAAPELSQRHHEAPPPDGH